MFVRKKRNKSGSVTQTMYELEYSLPGSEGRKRQLLKMDEEQQLLYDLSRKS